MVVLRIKFELPRSFRGLKQNRWFCVSTEFSTASRAESPGAMRPQDMDEELSEDSRGGGAMGWLL